MATLEQDIRQRHKGQARPIHDAVPDSPSKPKGTKTYGRTPDGTVFIVPPTHDMVSQLLDPRQPKNFSDALVLAILALHLAVAYALPGNLKRSIFAVIFLFWRAAYNIGIGYLLMIQSNHRLLVTWARKWKLFEHPPPAAPRSRKWFYRFFKHELEAKIPQDYDFDKAPIEYNSWLTFRRVVDLILMCDFVSYCLFALICANKPAGEGAAVALLRWAFGLLLFGFNIWVKLDAHRVVKDYAWYWGDFFYLIDQELTFDGVFEMAPHPMYSIGYAGYYGISMMAASYDVLFISILAHFAQFAFLTFVENPHIEKTYNPPPPRRRVESTSNSSSSPSISQEQRTLAPVAGLPGVYDLSLTHVHNLMGLQSIGLFRTADHSLILLLLYITLLTLVTPSTPFYQALFVGHAVCWRFWHSIGLGIILTKQSKDKMLVRHFLKYGDSAGEAWRQWKGMYHLSFALCHASFIAACWKMYSLPAYWDSGWVMLRHVLGIALVILQIWTAVSVYESLGEFGWFYGDFFFDSRAKLTYTSIYRFLNNPERVIGTAGLWGLALITWSRAVFIMALVGHLLALGFIAYVEKPHMQKIYGRKMRDEAGLTKFIKRSLPPPAKEWQMSVDRVFDEAKQFVDEFVETARPRLAAGVSSIVRDTTALFKVPARVSISRIVPDLAGYDPKHYALVLHGTRASSTDREKATGKESISARVPKGVKTMTFTYGAPIRVRWTAPANHGKKDWIGLYMVTDNRSREITEVVSLGRWVPTNRDAYETASEGFILSSDEPVSAQPSDAPDDVDLVTGEVIFQGDKLWWTQGVFEFRYHHDGKHNVMSISEPFEIRIDRFDDEDSSAFLAASSPDLYHQAVESALLPVVENCLDRDPDIAPSTSDELFGSHVERDSKYAKRVVYAIRHMFGIEFAPEVVPADGMVKKLAWRVSSAKQVLAPYSMSHSNGATTPTIEKSSTRTFETWL